MTKQKLLGVPVSKMKINQTLMKSNSCSQIWIENFWLELWLKFYFLPSPLKNLCLRLLLFIKGWKTVGQEGSGNLLIISNPRFRTFCFCLLGKLNWRDSIKVETQTTFKKLNKICLVHCLAFYFLKIVIFLLRLCTNICLVFLSLLGVSNLMRYANKSGENQFKFPP